MLVNYTGSDVIETIYMKVQNDRAKSVLPYKTATAKKRQAHYDSDMLQTRRESSYNKGAAVKRAAASNIAMVVKRLDSLSSATRATKSERMAIYTITAVSMVSITYGPVPPVTAAVI